MDHIIEIMGFKCFVPCPFLCVVGHNDKVNFALIFRVCLEDLLGFEGIADRASDRMTSFEELVYNMRGNEAIGACNEGFWHLELAISENRGRARRLTCKIVKTLKNQVKLCRQREKNPTIYRSFLRWRGPEKCRYLSLAFQHEGGVKVYPSNGLNTIFRIGHSPIASYVPLDPDANKLRGILPRKDDTLPHQSRQ